MLPCDEQREICKDFSVLWATFEPLAMNGPLGVFLTTIQQLHPVLRRQTVLASFPAYNLQGRQKGRQTIFPLSLTLTRDLII
ncbi:hypothetical protein LEMLEM_LOCUS4918 [Lemmus lemmus]